MAEITFYCFLAIFQSQDDIFANCFFSGLVWSTCQISFPLPLGQDQTNILNWNFETGCLAGWLTKYGRYWKKVFQLVICLATQVIRHPTLTILCPTYVSEIKFYFRTWVSLGREDPNFLYYYYCYIDNLQYFKWKFIKTITWLRFSKEICNTVQ